MKCAVLLRFSVALSSLSPVAPCALAGPTDGKVVAGNASIVQQGTRTDIVQSSDRTVIDWRTFSIGRGEAVWFQQQPNMIALNRVTGDQVSSVQGTLGAHGKVVLLNPNGILIGNGARIDTASFVASTGWADAGQFMEGRLQIVAPPRNADGTCPWSRCAGGSIVNQGVVTTNRDGGLVAFVAPHVRNDGQIWANLGTVMLASGTGIAVDLAGDNLIRVAVGAEQAKSLGLRREDVEGLRDVQGNPVRSLVEHHGTTVTNGGRVVMLTPAVASGIVDQAINLAGVVRADTANNGQPGTIELRAATGRIAMHGALGAIGRAPGQTGGLVTIAAADFAFDERAVVAASGSGDSRGRFVLEHAGTGLTIDPAMARALGGALGAATDVVIRSAGDVQLSARLDGRAPTPARSGDFTLTGQSVTLAEDIYTDGGRIAIQATGGGLAMVPAGRAFVGSRVDPLISAGSGPIELLASGDLRAHHLATSGLVAVTSTAGNVYLMQRLGHGEAGPLGGLRVRATGTPRPGIDADVADRGNVRAMHDIKVLAGGAIDVHATRNIVILEGPARAANTRAGLMEAFAGTGGRSLSLRSDRLGSTGQLTAESWYWAPTSLNSNNFLGGPDRNPLRPNDGRWTDLDRLARDFGAPKSPTRFAPGPINFAGRSAQLASVDPLPLAPDRETIPAALTLPVETAGPGPSPSAPEVPTLLPAVAQPSASQADADEAADATDLPRRGVAQLAAIGKSQSGNAGTDVFQSDRHVVLPAGCDVPSVAGNAYFATGSFGQSINSGCQ